MVVRIFIFLVRLPHGRADIGIAVAESGQGVEGAPSPLFVGKTAREFSFEQLFYPLCIVAVKLLGAFAGGLARYSALTQLLFYALFAHTAPLIELLRQGVGVALVIDIAQLLKTFDRLARKLRARAPSYLALELL